MRSSAIVICLTCACLAVGGLSGSFGFTAYAASGTGFIPLTSSTEKTRLPGKVIFSQLVTPSLEVAQQFYGKLFGWQFQHVPSRGARYAEIMLNGHPIASVVERAIPPGIHDVPFWMPFIATSDVDALARKAQNGGGKILFKPRDIPGLGRETVVADPQGGLFAALTTPSGDPVDETTPPDGWIWSTLLTPDPQGAGNFYQSLFGYETAPAPDSSDNAHLIAASQDYARASINPLPPHMPPNAPARWIRFLRVENVGAAAETATSLGGKILVEPHIDRDGALVAVLADPAGAVFGILEWHDQAPEGEPK
ncbi:VOC family protein [Kozakia baliensis]|uniref:VOC family protein n=1 Tax=Kozakia baliensis TaxID=153496 RepID=UPI00345BC417